MKNKLSEYRKKTDTLLSERALILSQIEEKEQERDKIQNTILQQEQARIVIQTVSTQTQNNLRTHINTITTSALHAVFGDKITFDCVFVPKRGKTECELVFIDKEGNQYKPIDSSGGGVLDVTSFALRCALWSLQQTRKTIILDEPFKYLSADLMDLAVDMIQMISQQLGLQMIIVSHIPKFINAADRLFTIEKKNKVSYLKV